MWHKQALVLGRFQLPKAALDKGAGQPASPFQRYLGLRCPCL